MPRAAFEPAIPANKRPKTYALERAATGIDIPSDYTINNEFESTWEEVVVAEFKVLSQNLSGGTEESH
jgi:hypothetical protein